MDIVQKILYTDPLLEKQDEAIKPMRPKQILSGGPSCYRTKVWVVFDMLRLMVIVGVVAMAFNALARNQVPPKMVEVPLPLLPVVKVIEPPSPPAAQINTRIVPVSVRHGDNLNLIRSRAGVSRNDFHRLMAADETIGVLRRIHEGESLKMRLDDDNRLLDLYYQPSELEEYHFQRNGDVFSAAHRKLPKSVQYTHYQGNIRRSLFDAIGKLELPDRIAMELVEIFRWDVDFTRMPANSSFRILLESIYMDTRFIGHGTILYAELVTPEAEYEAIHFEDRNGQAAYYSTEGKSLKKTFLRTPLKLDLKKVRISSSFNRKRMHPVLNYYRPHYGVDYAVPRGTPVLASGDGYILEMVHGHREAGNYIVIQHAGNYKTRYLHLSGFEEDMAEGVFVTQGRPIGFVGMTGSATGSHLHYELLSFDTPVDPVAVTMHPETSVPAEKMPLFRQVVHVLRQELGSHDQNLRFAAQQKVD